MPTKTSIDRTIRQHYHLVEKAKAIARHRYPASLDINEVESRCAEALWHCVERYDEERGVSFESFARTRVIGAMRDVFRLRFQRNKMREAERTGIPFHTFRVDDAPEDGSPPVSTRLEQKEFWGKVERLLDNSSQFYAVRRYYQDGLMMKEIAEEEGVQESAIWQRIKRAVDRLRVFWEIGDEEARTLRRGL